MGYTDGVDVFMKVPIFAMNDHLNIRNTSFGL
jgi:hypothetical protein